MHLTETWDSKPVGRRAQVNIDHTKATGVKLPEAGCDHRLTREGVWAKSVAVSQTRLQQQANILTTCCVVRDEGTISLTGAGVATT